MLSPRRIVPVALLLFGAVLPAQDAGQEAPEVRLGTGRHTYTWVRGFGQIPDSPDLGNTHGCIAVDSAGRIYFNTDTERSICVFEPDGTFVKAWGKEFAGGLHGMTLAREGDREVLYLAHIGRHEVMKTTLDGEVLWRRGFPEEAGIYKGAGQYRPTDVVVAPNGSIYVADGYGQSWVHQFQQDGTYVRSWGGKGTAPGQMRTPHGICVDNRGDEPRLIVADRENGRLQIFDLDGGLRGVVSGIFRRPCNVYMHPNGRDLVVPDLAGRVTILNEKNELVCHLGDQPDPGKRAKNGIPKEQWRDGEFLSPHGAAFDANGDLYVMDWNRHGRVTRLAVQR